MSGCLIESRVTVIEQPINSLLWVELRLWNAVDDAGWVDLSWVEDDVNDDDNDDDSAALKWELSPVEFRRWVCVNNMGKFVVKLICNLLTNCCQRKGKKNISLSRLNWLCNTHTHSTHTPHATCQRLIIKDFHDTKFAYCVAAFDRQQLPAIETLAILLAKKHLRWPISKVHARQKPKSQWPVRRLFNSTIASTSVCVFL